MQEHNTKPTAIIITGMHRSGTSLTASLLESAGINIGKNLMPPNEWNPKGYFENMDFYYFHRDALKSKMIHPDGWTLEHHDLNLKNIEEEFIEKAKALIKENSQNKYWGWKDPRTTLFLDFWLQLIPDAYFVFVYRCPWEVVDSLYRRGTDQELLINSTLAVEMWIKYNKKILSFYDQHRDRCILANINTLANNEVDFIKSLNQKFGINLESPSSDLYNKFLLTNQLSLESHRPTLINFYFPEAIEIYQELENLSWHDHSQNDLSWRNLLKTSLKATWHLQDWMTIRNLERKNKQLMSELMESKSQNFKNQASGEGIQNNLQKTESLLEESQAQLHQAESLLDESQSQLEKATTLLHQFQSQLSQTECLLEQSQLQFHETQEELQKTQSQLHQTENLLEQSQSQLHQTENFLDQFQSQLHQTQTELEEADFQLHKTQEELKQSNQQRHQLEIELQQTKLLQQETNFIAKESHIKLSQTYQQLTQAQSELDLAQRQLDLVQQQLQQSQWDEQRYLFQLHQVQEEVEQSDLEREQLLTQTEQLEFQLAESEVILSQLSMQLQQTQKQEERFQIQLHQTLEELEQTQTDLQQDRKALQQVTHQAKQLKRDLKRSNSQLYQVQGELDLYHSQLEKSALEQEQKQTDLTQTKSEFHQTQRELKQKQAQIHELQTELKRSQSQLHQLQVELAQSQLQIEQIQQRQRLEQTFADDPKKHSEMNYNLLIWDAWNAYRNGKLPQMKAHLQKALKLTKTSPSETILTWLESFSKLSLAQGLELDSHSLTNSDEWKQLMRQMTAKKGVPLSFMNHSLPPEQAIEAQFDNLQPVTTVITQSEQA